MNRHAFVLGLLLTLGIAGPAAAQCPDGSAPPCRSATARATPQLNSVGVLYFDNLSRDTADAFLVDGLTEAIIDRLGRVPRLAVKSRQAMRQFRERPQDPVAIGRAIKATYLVGGSFRRSGERLRITVELLRTATGDRLWGDRYERTERDLFTIESEIVGDVATAIVGRLQPFERQAIATGPTANLEAYRLYLRGRFELNRLTEQGFHAAAAYFRRAISLDSMLAPAFAGLADAYNLRADYEPPRNLIDSMHVAAQRAVWLQPNSADALNALGFIQYVFEWNPAAAEQTYRRAVAIAPTNPTAHLRLSELLAGEQQFDAALAAARRAVDLDPGAARNYVGVLILARRYDEALVASEAAAAADPTDLIARLLLGFVQALLRRCEEGIDELERGRALQPNDPYVLATLSNAYAWCNRDKNARSVLDHLREQSRNDYVPAVSFAYVFAGLNERDSAFMWLERAMTDRAAQMVYLNVQPIWDPLRADPRFAALVRRVGLRSR